ncbi:helix-turn-helix domain-containing protein [Zongyangia hominis]|uniref:Helix-turn-helix transcriptional regulator n=1 Tax=Zongyangia hominis TaxID=2763677 RepID=A0A926EFW9_9FIRM|nr:helix-turn-helix transcriptional regulator [Zongyangia hominis]MBC8570957.1 helix-turn-helix transcriptional regulator [Zongyangia hominis]
MSVKINLKEILKEKRMTMKELSVLTGIRPNTISNLSKETAMRIQFDQIDALCKALDCTVGELFEYIPDKK